MKFAWTHLPLIWFMAYLRGIYTLYYLVNPVFSDALHQKHNQELEDLKKHWTNERESMIEDHRKQTAILQAKHEVRGI